ncbi:hypothetical protein P153DRAFT_365657 [Dothidotthia symphoricarpi CBS 119687]|uniref:UBA domain-containing protein n=1 Tax=Dothidotthia symphoricarpi CBS 119687 TaxID=1392245 RepID=A0A6A6AGX6_9PLEO|nr:uncharacterized protein P153DRAFT_365657 [Dothidotthia symphoricarpi CBS 119687]KAF2131050.1 hypothetical protein P153DRAFT_365657 [Dothidotthia symphoricarpi CBS 119687]
MLGTSVPPTCCLLLISTDEWCYYLLTFGLSTVLKLAGPHLLPDSSPFMVASWNGWTAWKPPVSGSTRRNFLKEAASRVYEDKIAHVYAESSSREVQREISKARIQKYITELQQRKNSGERIPMSQERPMSEWDSNGLMRSHPALTLETNLVSYIPSLRSATSNYTVSPDLSASVHELSAVETSRSSSPLRRTVAEPLLPTPTSSTVPSTRDRSSMAISLAPINEYPDHGGYREVHPLPPVSNHPVSRSSNTSVSLQRPSQNNGNVPQAMREESSLAAFWQPHTRNDINVPIFSQPRTHNDNSTSPISRGSNEGSPGSAAHLQHDRLQNMYNSESHLNTADKAIYRIVEMGFTSAQAREALRITDRGDGLRVDRAVELLLRRAM